MIEQPDFAELATMKISRQAFTLIELLVVIAIIAILAAILFPVFAQAKVAAKKSVSISNQKQMGLAQLMYSGDYDDTVVSSWARGFPGDSGFWVQPYMKNLDILFNPNKTISVSSLATVCGDAAGDPYGSYELLPGQRDNPTGVTSTWGYGINKGAQWMDGTGLQVSAPTPPNKGQVVTGTIGGLTVNVTVWSVHQGISLTSVVSPSNTFFFADSGELPRMSMQLQAMTPNDYPNLAALGWVSPCFTAAHQGLPYAGGNTYLFTDGHVKWEKYNGTPTSLTGAGGGAPMVSANPCRYDANHDPSENYQNCQSGWN